MYPTCNLPCHYLLSPLSECQRLLIEKKGVEFLLWRWGCLPAIGIDEWLTGVRFLRVISSYRQDLRGAQSPVAEWVLVPVYYTCHLDWKDVLTQVFYLFSRVQGNFERTRWVLAVHQKERARKKEGRKEKRKRKNRKEGSKEGKNNTIKNASKSLLWKKLCVKNK